MCGMVVVVGEKERAVSSVCCSREMMTAGAKGVALAGAPQRLEYPVMATQATVRDDHRRFRDTGMRAKAIGT